MAYVGPADTSRIEQHLGDHPRMLLLFQRAMGIELAGPGAELPADIADYPRTSDGKAGPAYC